MNKVLCFGELLLRLSPQLGGVWIQNQQMPVFVGGAELNVATALSNWQVPVDYMTALPANYLSGEIEQYLSEKNIGTGKIIFSGDRIGAYYLPQGADLKNAGVIYDRAHSSFSHLQPGMIDWDLALDGVSWFHFSAISPALSSQLAAVCKEGAEAAAGKNITVSVDLNYRAKLWQYGKQPLEVMRGLVSLCDVVMGNIWAAEKMLGLPAPGEQKNKEGYIEQSELSSERLVKSFPKCMQVANTFRFDEGDALQYYATLYSEGNLFVSKEHGTNSVIDRVGSGDSFMAGLIYGNYHLLPAQETIELAAAAAFAKLFITGDASTASIDEIRKRYLDHA